MANPLTPEVALINILSFFPIQDLLPLRAVSNDFYRGVSILINNDITKKHSWLKNDERLKKLTNLDPLNEKIAEYFQNLLMYKRDHKSLLNSYMKEKILANKTTLAEFNDDLIKKISEINYHITRLHSHIQYHKNYLSDLQTNNGTIAEIKRYFSEICVREISNLPSELEILIQANPQKTTELKEDFDKLEYAFYSMLTNGQENTVEEDLKYFESFFSLLYPLVKKYWPEKTEGSVYKYLHNAADCKLKIAEYFGRITIFDFKASMLQKLTSDKSSPLEGLSDIFLKRFNNVKNIEVKLELYRRVHSLLSSNIDRLKDGCNLSAVILMLNQLPDEFKKLLSIFLKNNKQYSLDLNNEEFILSEEKIDNQKEWIDFIFRWTMQTDKTLTNNIKEHEEELIKMYISVVDRFINFNINNITE